jgi:hypothetical protein
LLIHLSPTENNKMKKVLTLLAIGILAGQGIFAQTTENFNSRSGATTSQVKGWLQNQCWQFQDFDINRNGWNPGIEGDGAMVSGPGNLENEKTGIFSQVMNLKGSLPVSFKYKLSNPLTSRRWFKIYLTDQNNNPVQLLDSLELGSSACNGVCQYNKTFPTPAGPYKIYLNFQGNGGSNRIAIDELMLGAFPYYSGGCNQSPVAVNDNITGQADHHASGSVLPHDYDPDHEPLTAHLLSGSPDGTVLLQPDGSFTFSPNPGFNGTHTSFTYIDCDNGVPNRCSAPATATVNFAANGSLPINLADLSGIYQDNTVKVRWTTTYEVNGDHFDIERSLDGLQYTKVGTVKAAGNSSSRRDYVFSDAVKQGTLARHDLYYRLIETDADGKNSVSKVLVVRVYQTRAIQSVSVTPNPAVNDIKVNMQLNSNSFVVMKVMNNSGTEIMHQNVRGTTGDNNFTMEGTSRLQAGMYLLELIINSNERMLVKLIKG